MVGIKSSVCISKNSEWRSALRWRIPMSGSLSVGNKDRKELPTETKPISGTHCTSQPSLSSTTRPSRPPQTQHERQGIPSGWNIAPSEKRKGASNVGITDKTKADRSLHHKGSSQVLCWRIVFVCNHVRHQWIQSRIRQISRVAPEQMQWANRMVRCLQGYDAKRGPPTVCTDATKKTQNKATLR